MYDIGIPEIKCTDRLEDTQGRSVRYNVEAETNLFFGLIYASTKA